MLKMHALMAREHHSIPNLREVANAYYSLPDMDRDKFISIGWKESRFRSKTIAPGNNYGLDGVNIYWHSEYAPDSLLVPLYNVRASYAIYVNKCKKNILRYNHSQEYKDDIIKLTKYIKHIGENYAQNAMVGN